MLIRKIFCMTTVILIFLNLLTIGEEAMKEQTQAYSDGWRQLIVCVKDRVYIVKKEFSLFGEKRGLYDITNGEEKKILSRNYEILNIAQFEDTLNVRWGAGATLLDPTYAETGVECLLIEHNFARETNFSTVSYNQGSNTSSCHYYVTNCGVILAQKHSTKSAGWAYKLTNLSAKSSALPADDVPVIDIHGTYSLRTYNGTCTIVDLKDGRVFSFPEDKLGASKFYRGILVGDSLYYSGENGLNELRLDLCENRLLVSGCEVDYIYSVNDRIYFSNEDKKLVEYNIATEEVKYYSASVEKDQHFVVTNGMLYVTVYDEGHNTVESIWIGPMVEE